MGEETLYERIGGQETVTRLVGQFYKRVLADEELAPFFAGSPMDHLERMQSEFFAAALDGPSNYTGRDLTKAHFGRNITPHHFTLFVHHFGDTMREIGVSEEDIEAVLPRISLYVNHVCGGYGLDG